MKLAILLVAAITLLLCAGVLMLAAWALLVETYTFVHERREAARRGAVPESTG